MNPIAHLLPKFGKTQDTSKLSEEELDKLDAEAKKDRIEFHASKVRNGPANFSFTSNGQQRRRAARDKASFERKINRRNRRAFKGKQYAHAVLRGQLQVLGIVECRLETTVFTPHQKVSAAQWVVQNYGPRDDEGSLILSDDVLDQSIAAAREAYIKAAGVPA